MTNDTIVGKKIPNFVFETHANGQKSMADYAGKNKVFYFYPKDHTPGCTLEAQDFRDHIKAFEKLNTVVFGISRDSTACHQRFVAKHQLPFILISDQDSELCKWFDVLRPKNFFGKLINGIQRSTFIINTEDIVQQEWRGVKVKGHVEAVLEALK